MTDAYDEVSVLSVDERTANVAIQLVSTNAYPIENTPQSRNGSIKVTS